MARSGHGRALEEHRMGFGQQFLPSGLGAFPVSRKSEHHRSINQKLPELWSDFSDRGALHGRSRCEQSARYHGDAMLDDDEADELEEMRMELNRRKEAHVEELRSFRYDAEKYPSVHLNKVRQREWLQDLHQERQRIRKDEEELKRVENHPSRFDRGKVTFVGFAEFDMDGRVHTAGEMDRLMLYAASAKYPCARPATFDEYSEGRIVGLPRRNFSGRDIVFVGPGATGCELNHTNTLGAQKAMIPAGDPLDGTWGAAALYGRKCVICVYPTQRIKRQQSLMQFGLARESASRSTGNFRRTGSLTCLTDKTRWTNGDYGAAGSTNMSQRMTRSDQFFR